MPIGTTFLTRLFIVSLLSLGLIGMATSPAAAQGGEICSPNGALALADSNGDGVVSLGEIDEVIALAGGNAELQALRDQAAAKGITGIRYTGCTPDGSGGNGDAATGGGAGGSGTSGTGNAGTSGTGSGAGGSGANQAEAGASGSSASGTSSTETTSSDSDATTSAVTGLPATGAGDLDSNQGAGVELFSSSSMLLAAAGSFLVFAGVFSLRSKKA